MTRFEKVYESYESYKERQREKLVSEVQRRNSLNREGYGYIKRRVGLLSNEVEGPTYLSISELSSYIKKYIRTD